VNTSRIWTLGAVIAVVAIIAAGFGLGVQPQLAAASAADSSTTQAQSQNSTTQVELAQLARLAATQSTLEATNATLGSAVTGSLRLSSFSRQVRTVAALDGVTLISLSPATAKPYAAAPSGTAAASTASTASTTSTTTASATPGEFGKVDALITPTNFVLIPITITVSGEEAAAVQFASDAQHLNRLFAVDTVDFATGNAAGVAPTTTISGSIYALKG
jgi:Tfp pilus assembly protein PilO